jgi:hypothetical protein
MLQLEISGAFIVEMKFEKELGVSIVRDEGSTDA